MSSLNQTQKLRRSRSFTEGTGRAVTFANLRCGIPPSTTLESNPITRLEVSRAPFHSSGTYLQPRSDGAADRYNSENARNLSSIPQLTTPDVRIPAHETAPSLLTDESRSSTPDSASQSHDFPSSSTTGLQVNSPFRDRRLLERLRLALYGANIIDDEVTVNFAKSVVHYVGNNYQQCENFVTHADTFCRFLESRRDVGEIPITDVLEVLRVTPGWPFGKGEDEVTQAWNLLYFITGLPLFTIPITISCKTIQEQIRTMFPPVPPHAMPLNFKTTLSDILRAGLKVKPAVYFFEHLQMEKDGNDVTVMFKCAGPYSAGFYRSYLHNRAAKALHMEGWMKEIIGSTFALFGNKPYDKTAHDLRLFVPGKLGEFHMMRTLFREFGNTPPKLLAHRAIELENLVRSRRAFWPTLRRDLRRQRKGQPFAFWGSILALFFGICTVIQTVASVWALVQNNNSQASQTMPGNAVNGMRILGSPWLTCMKNEQLMAETKENATISCLLQIGIQ